jgi:peroxiredoxin
MNRTQSVARGLRLVLLLATALFAGGPAAATEVGKPAPAFSGADTRGNAWTLDGLAGKSVILEWTNHDCPYVRKHYGSGNMQALQKEAAEAGYVWLSVVSSAPGKQGHVNASEADELTRSRGAAPMAVLLDEAGEIGRAYGARTTPHMYIVGPDGTLLYMGGIDDIRSSDPTDIPKAKNYVRAAMADIAAGRPVADAVTPPYGCSVKY